MRGYLMKTRFTKSLGIEYPKSLPTVEFDNTADYRQQVP